MKKSFAELLSQKRKRERAKPPSQKPGNEKPDSIAQSLKKLKSRISANDLRFLKSIKYEQPKPAHAGTTRNLTYAPTEKPW